MKKIDFQENLRVLLYRRFKWVENYLLSQAKSSEYDYLSLSQIRVFAFMRGRDLTISDLAKLINVSRQAVQKTISTLVDQGLMELTESPDNRSAKLIKITDKGHKMQLWSKRVIDKAERELAAKIGPEKLELLKEILGEDWN
jgi:DNA-binding MarR family transcriptional regulator